MTYSNGNKILSAHCARSPFAQTPVIWNRETGENERHTLTNVQIIYFYFERLSSTERTAIVHLCTRPHSTSTAIRLFLSWGLNAIGPTGRERCATDQTCGLCRSSHRALRALFPCVSRLTRKRVTTICYLLLFGAYGELRIYWRIISLERNFGVFFLSIAAAVRMFRLFSVRGRAHKLAEQSPADYYSRFLIVSNVHLVWRSQTFISLMSYEVINTYSKAIHLMQDKTENAPNKRDCAPGQRGAREKKLKRIFACTSFNGRLCAANDWQ